MRGASTEAGVLGHRGCLEGFILGDKLGPQPLQVTVPTLELKAEVADLRLLLHEGLTQLEKEKDVAPVKRSTATLTPHTCTLIVIGTRSPGPRSNFYLTVTDMTYISQGRVSQPFEQFGKLRPFCAIFGVSCSFLCLSP